MVGKVVLLLQVLLTTERAAEAQRTEKIPRLCFTAFGPRVPRSFYSPFFPPALLLRADQVIE
jgi:hypothetical protein